VSATSAGNDSIDLMKFAHGNGTLLSRNRGGKVAIWRPERLDEKPSRHRRPVREYIRFAMKRADDQKPSSRRLAKISDS
jgi:hypothetical protein